MLSQCKRVLDSFPCLPIPKTSLCSSHAVHGRSYMRCDSSLAVAVCILLLLVKGVFQ